jgi:hypothetical protein
MRERFEKITNGMDRFDLENLVFAIFDNDPKQQKKILEIAEKEEEVNYNDNTGLRIGGRMILSKTKQELVNEIKWNHPAVTKMFIEGDFYFDYQRIGRENFRGYICIHGNYSPIKEQREKHCKRCTRNGGK